MQNYPPEFILLTIPEEQKRGILIKDDIVEHCVQLFTIVLAEVDDKYIVFYLYDIRKPGHRCRLVVYNSLTAAKELLGEDFVQPNQSMVFNRIYLKDIEDGTYVHLHYPVDLPTIKITEAFRKSFFASLPHRL